MKKTTFIYSLGFLFMLLACDAGDYEQNPTANLADTVVTAEQGKPSPVKEATTPAQLTVSPNPATEIAVAGFNVGTQYQNATGIAVYDVTGVQRLQQKVSGKQGEVQLNISHLAPGTYMVNLQADGVNIAQQKLIKK